MAKTKSNSTDKSTAMAGKSAASEPNVPLRRSPRKSVQTAKNVESEEVPASSRVAKKAAPAKKSMTEKLAALKKKTTKTSKPGVVDGEVSTKGVRASESSKTTPIISPKKRGRPKKEVPTEATTSNSSKAANSKMSPSPSKRGEVAHSISTAPEPEEPWTDSPKKKKPSKVASKTMPNGASSAKLLPAVFDHSDDARIRQASLGGVKKSIEGPSDVRFTRATSRSKSPARSPPKSPAASPSAVARKFSAARTPSRERSRANSRDRSRSASKSIARNATTGKSRSPSKETPKQGPRTRSKSPANAVDDSKVEAEKRDRTGGKTSSRSPSLCLPEKAILIPKTRTSRSPAKSPARSPSRSRQASPVKRPLVHRAHVGTGRLSGSPARTAPPGSTRGSRSPSRPSSEESKFANRFVAKDEYGRALREIEFQAYRATKNGGRISGSVPQVNKEDGRRAQERGVQRAELELGLNRTAGNKEQRAREDADALLRLPSEEEQPSILETRIQELIDQYKDNDEVAETVSRRSSPAAPSAAPRTTPGNVSPKKGKQTKVPESRRAEGVNGDDLPLQPGEPSASNRGGVHSVTNPQFIPGTQKKNPFFETMPAPEVWHRNMPCYFPFGETPFIQRVMSGQISEDLAKGEAQGYGEKNSDMLGRATTAIKSGLSAVGQSIWGGPPREPPSSPPWKLPDVAEFEVNEALREIQGTYRGTAKVTVGQKRKISAADSSAKRVRRRSSGCQMSGAL